MYDVQFVVQGLSVAQPTFDMIEPADFRSLAGILVPPLLKLAQSFIYAHSHAVKGSLCSMLLMVWCSYVAHMGYTPLTRSAMRSTNMDEDLIILWEQHFPPL